MAKKIISWDVSDVDKINRAEAEFQALAAAGYSFYFPNKNKDPHLEGMPKEVKAFDACYGYLEAAKYKAPPAKDETPAAPPKTAKPKPKPKARAKGKSKTK